MKYAGKKLPLEFSNNPITNKIFHYVQQSSVNFSSILYKTNKTYLIIKNEKTPYFQLDWRSYSIMRAWANTLITTGSILRHEKQTFKTKGTFQDPVIEQLYSSIRQTKKQNVVVLSRKMSIQDQKPYINDDFYELTSYKSLMNSSELDLLAFIQKLKEKEMGPVLLQCGVSILNQYLLEAQKIMLLDLIILCEFEGELPEECIGDPFNINLRNYKLLQELQEVEVNKGKLKFLIYGRNDKVFQKI